MIWTEFIIELCCCKLEFHAIVVCTCEHGIMKCKSCVEILQPIFTRDGIGSSQPESIP